MSTSILVISVDFGIICVNRNRCSPPCGDGALWAGVLAKFLALALSDPVNRHLTLGLSITRSDCSCLRVSKCMERIAPPWFPSRSSGRVLSACGSSPGRGLLYASPIVLSWREMADDYGSRSRCLISTAIMLRKLSNSSWEHFKETVEVAFWRMAKDRRSKQPYPKEQYEKGQFQLFKPNFPNYV